MLNNLSILIVEDSTPLVALYEKWLTRLRQAFPGATITKVDTMRAAKKFVATASPDCTILDLNLGDMMWENTLKEIRDLAEHGPVIVVTGLAHPGLEEKSMEKGADAFIFKSELIGNEGLLERLIVKVLNRHWEKKKGQFAADIEALRAFAQTHQET